MSEKKNFVVENSDGERIWSGYAQTESDAWEHMIVDTKQEGTAVDDLKAAGHSMIVVSPADAIVSNDATDAHGA